MIVFRTHYIYLILVGYHTTTTPSSTSSSTSSTNAGSRLKHDYENGSGRGNTTNESNSNTGQQQQQSAPWSSLVKAESPHGLRGKNKTKNSIIHLHHLISLDAYSTFSSQSFFPHNAHRFGSGAAGKKFFN